MMSYIDNYIGEWEDKIGKRIVIRKIDDETALVSFFSVHDHKPIHRPWCNGKPSVDMVAKYHPEWSPEIIVELCEDGKGFELHLAFELDYYQDKNGPDVIVPSLSRYEDDDFIGQYYRLFEPLEHYIKRNV